MTYKRLKDPQKCGAISHTGLSLKNWKHKFMLKVSFPFMLHISCLKTTYYPCLTCLSMHMSKNGKVIILKGSKAYLNSLNNHQEMLKQYTCLQSPCFLLFFLPFFLASFACFSCFPSQYTLFFLLHEMTENGLGKPQKIESWKTSRQGIN